MSGLEKAISDARASKAYIGPQSDAEVGEDMSWMKGKLKNKMDALKSYLMYAGTGIRENEHLSPENLARLGQGQAPIYPDQAGGR